MHENVKLVHDWTYTVRVVMCDLCNKLLCVCMLQSEGCWLPFAPASSVCAIWQLGRTDVLWLARHPCWYPGRGCSGRLPVFCLLLHECSDRCRWIRKSGYLFEGRAALNTVNPLLFCTQFTLDERMHLRSSVTCCIHKIYSFIEPHYYNKKEQKQVNI